MTMDFQSAMETFAEAWVAANTKCTPLSEASTQNQAMALTKGCRTPPSATTPVATGATNRDSVERATTPALPRSSASHESIVSPPAKDDFTHAKSSTGKTLPVHCIIEVITTYEDSRLLHQSPWKRRSFVDSDSYVIIPTSTPFHQVVNTVLIHLGYSHDNVLTAKGSVVIKNWKALSVDQISDDPHVTVEDILGELTTVATLRIQVSRSRSTVLMDMKEKLLCFFIKQSRGLLNSSGCPIDEHLLSQICRFGYGNEIPAAEISEDSFRKFDQWWSSQLPTLSPNNRSSLTPYGCQYPLVPLHNSKSLERTDPPHPAIQNVHNQFPTQKTRMRTSFDPELELPKLQQWFSDNQHPNRQQIQQYVKELNSLESRRGRKPLDMNNVVYWFKNARAAQKRAEVRNINPAVSSHMPINGYSDHNSSVLSMADCYLNAERSADHAKNNSPTSYKRSYQDRRLSDDLSNDSSEEEDEIDNQSRSPTAPLSLTTSDKNDYPRSSTPSSEIQIVNPKIEPKEEPINYHSPEHNSTKINASDTEENGEMNEENKPRVRSPPTTPQSDRSVPHNYCESPDFDRHIQSRGPNDGLERLTAGFPLVPFNHSIMYMNQYIPGLPHSTGAPSLSADERRKRNRTFIDPVTEVPKLEYWFSVNTHPTHNSIVQYTDALNCMSYRQKFPRLEPKNVQFWFKNRRAKCKRLKMSMFDSQSSVHYHEDRE